jgi:hypothetical protein
MDKIVWGRHEITDSPQPESKFCAHLFSVRAQWRSEKQSLPSAIVSERLRRVPMIARSVAVLAHAQAEHRKPGGNPYDVRNGSKLSERGGDGGTSVAYLMRRLARGRWVVFG